MAKVLEDLRAKGIPYRVGGEWPNPELEENRAVGPAGIARPTVRPRPPGPRPVPTAPDAAFGPVGDNGWFRSPVTPPLDSVPPEPAQPARPDYQDRAGFGRPETGPGGLPLHYVEPGRPAMPGPTEMFPDVPNIGPMEKIGNRIQQGYKELSGQFANANSPGEALGAGVKAGVDFVGDVGVGLGTAVERGVGEAVAGFTGVPYVPGDKVAEEDSSNAPGSNAPGSNAPSIPKTGPYATSGMPGGWARTTTQSATDPNREIAAYSDGKGNYLTGERAAGTGGGTFNVMPATPVPQGNQTAPAPQIPTPRSAAPNQRGVWGEALDDYMSGRVGSEGYRMVKNFVGGSLTNTDGSPNIPAMARMKQLTGLAGQEMESQADMAGRGPDAADLARIQQGQQDMFLKQQKAVQDQTNADREYALSQTETDLKKAEYMDEFRQNFRERFSLAGVEGAPYERLAQDALRISQSTGMSPYDVQQRMVEELGQYKGKDLAWDDPKKYENFLLKVGTQR